MMRVLYVCLSDERFRPLYKALVDPEAFSIFGECPFVPLVAPTTGEVTVEPESAGGGDPARETSDLRLRIPRRLSRGYSHFK